MLTKLLILMNLGLAVADANALEVTSITMAQDRIEGQSVAVSAVVDFGDRIVGPAIPNRNASLTNVPCIALAPDVPKGSPLSKAIDCDHKPPANPSRPVKLSVKSISRTVTAELLAADHSSTRGLVQAPPINTTIQLNFTGSGYTGQFPFLPFDDYTVRVTATQEERQCTTFNTRFIHRCSAPVTTTNTKISGPFSVLPPQSGCFQFKRDQANNPSGLNGWTVSGVFGGTSEFPPPSTINQMPVTWLDQDGFLSASATDQDGALVQNLQPTFFPANPASGFWRIDFVSPDVTAMPEWQNTTGLTFRMLRNFAAASLLSVRPALRVTDASGNDAFRRQMSGPTTEQFLNVGMQPYQVVVSNFPLVTGDSVKQIIISVFGTPAEVAPFDTFIALDGVCPKH
jgi:hypothetical protein